MSKKNSLIIKNEYETLVIKNEYETLVINKDKVKEISLREINPWGGPESKNEAILRIITKDKEIVLNITSEFKSKEKRDERVYILEVFPTCWD